MSKTQKAEKAIQDFKNRLIRKAKRIGLWENFGQEEVGVLESQYNLCRYSQNDENKKVWKLIRAFDTWCMNVSDKDLI